MDLNLYRRWFALPPRRVSGPEPELPAPPAPREPDRWAPARIRVFSYDSESLEEAEVLLPEDLARWKGRRAITWVDVDGLADPDRIGEVARVFGLHGLAVQDVLNPIQRPKAERYGDCLFVVSRMLLPLDRGIASEQLSLFLGPDFVLTFQQRQPGDCLEPVRARLRSGEGRLRRMGPDFLAWALLDAVVDGYFPLLEAFGERLDDLEDTIIDRPSSDCIQAIHQVKRDLLSLRRAAFPLRDALASLLREDSPRITADTRMYLRDCLDHSFQVLDMIETYREIVAGLMEAYQSSVGNRLNAVMKVLTIIATVFMPLSFLAGVYGMNFDTAASPFNMPELSWRFGYPFFWGVALAVGGAMIWWFRRQGWLGGQGRWD